MNLLIYRKKLFILALIGTASYYLWQSFGYLEFENFAGQALLLGFVIYLTVQNYKSYSYPNEFLLPAIGVGVVFNALVAYKEFDDIHFLVKTIGLSILGILVGGGYFFVMRCINRFVYKNEHKEYPVWADIKLIAAIGSFVGPLVIWVAIIESVVLFIFAVIYKFMSNSRKKIDATNMPTGVAHFIGLIIFYSYHTGVLNFATVLLCIAITYLLSDSLIHEEKIAL